MSDMALQRSELPTIKFIPKAHSSASYRAQFRSLLSGDLNFQGQDSAYASHNYHASPAKFPPQLPRKLIDALIGRSNVMLEPMMDIVLAD